MEGVNVIMLPIVLLVIFLMGIAGDLSWAQSFQMTLVSGIGAIAYIGIATWIVRTLPFWLNVLLALALAILWRAL